MLRVKYLTLCLLVVAFAGCGTGTQQGTQPTPEQPAADQPATAPAADAANATPTTEQPAAPAPAPAKPARRSPPPAASSVAPPSPSSPPGLPAAVAPPSSPPPAPAPAVAVVASGTRLEIRLIDGLDSAKNAAGEKFQAMLDKDLEVDGKVLARKGSNVTGKIISAEGSGRVEGRAKMAIALTAIEVNEKSYAIRTNRLAFEAESTAKKDAVKVGGGAGLGAIIGAIAGGGKGAAIGAAIGGGAGAATVLATRGKEVKFEPEQKFSFVLDEDVKIPFP